jgi:hypothetical protein
VGQGALGLGSARDHIGEEEVMAGPFGATFERLGDMLINKVADEVLGDSGGLDARGDLQPL